MSLWKRGWKVSSRMPGLKTSRWLRIGRKVPFYYLKQKLAGSRLYKETKTLGSAVAVHREILKMFKTRFGKIPGRWIFNFAHAAARESNLNRESPQDNLKFVKKVISVSLRTSLQLRYYIPLNEIKTLLRWYISAKKQVWEHYEKNTNRWVRPVSVMTRLKGKINRY